MSKIVKGIGKAAKGILSGVKKVFKSVTKSPIGKALLIGATIYLGGAALGMWQSPFASINGALAGGAPPVVTATTQSVAPAVLGGGDVAGSVVAGAGGSAGGTAAAGLSAADAAGLAQMGKAANLSGSALQTFINSGGTLGSAAAGGGGVASKGIIDSVLEKVGGWYSNQPDLVKFGLVHSGAEAVKSMFSPGPLDVLNERQRLEEESRAQQLATANQNWNVSGVNMGMSPPRPGAPLRDAYGNLVFEPQTGIINSVMRRA